MKANTLFSAFYVSFYGLLFVALLVLLVITPADAVNQALSNKQIYNAIVVAGCYFLTLCLAVLIYLSRMYTNRAVLSSIPKNWIPVEKGDVNKRVRKMIVGSLARSATIAWDSRPRIPALSAPPPFDSESQDPVSQPTEADINSEQKESADHTSGTRQETAEQTVKISPARPIWGVIAHDGWSSPTSPDLPNLQYTTVILELPHLIEARAVSLAPPDPESTTVPPMPDIRAVDLLQRPATMGLRDYVSQLISVGVITSTSGTEFLASYEYARFSARPLSESEFRNLMKQFSDVLRSMNPLNPSFLTCLEVESDIDGDISSTSTPNTHRSRSLASGRSIPSRSSSEGTIRTAPSRLSGTNNSPAKKREGFITAPATPRSKKRLLSKTPSVNSFAQSRIPYAGSSESSSESLRSTSQSSVIRLRTTNEEGELPYILNIPDAR